MPFAELPDMQQVIFTGSDAHMPSPYLDAAPQRSIQQGGDVRGRATALRKCRSESSGNEFSRNSIRLEGSNRPAIGYGQSNNAMGRASGTNASNRSPVRGPIRGSHRATEE